MSDVMIRAAYILAGSLEKARKDLQTITGKNLSEGHIRKRLMAMGLLKK